MHVETGNNSVINGIIPRFSLHNETEAEKKNTGPLIFNTVGTYMNKVLGF